VLELLVCGGVGEEEAVSVPYAHATDDATTSQGGVNNWDGVC
jgi:hypothetical protein